MISTSPSTKEGCSSSDCATTAPREGFPATDVLGLPLSVISFDEALREVDRRVAVGQPGFWITANLNYAMLSTQLPRLHEVNAKADLVLADGMPLVWASRFTDRPLPHRVTGSDLTPAICRLAAEKGYRLFLLGAAPGVAARAAEILQREHPSVNIVGVESPPFRDLAAEENKALISRIRSSNADILLVALGQPKGELWLAENIDALRVPVAVQIGASFDFLVGSAHRAPKVLQWLGLEWAHRLYCEPERLARRYLCNFMFLMKYVLSAFTNRSRKAEGSCQGSQ